MVQRGSSISRVGGRERCNQFDGEKEEDNVRLRMERWIQIALIKSLLRYKRHPPMDVLKELGCRRLNGIHAPN